MTGWIVFGAIVLVVGALVIRSKLKPKEVVPPGGYSAAPLEELSAALQAAFRDVADANEKCDQAQGPWFVAAWRELHAVLASSTAAVHEVLGDRPSPRLARMVRVAAEELWEMSDRHLNAHTPTTPEDVALAERGERLRVESLRRGPQQV